MNIKKHIVFISVFVSLTVTVICLFTAYIYFEKVNYLNFEAVTEIEVDRKLIDAEHFPWMSIIAEKYNPFFDETYLTNSFGDAFSDGDTFLNKENYSYIITFGKKLNLIGYKYCEARTKYFGIIPKQLIGRVSLSNETDNKIYVY